MSNSFQGGQYSSQSISNSNLNWRNRLDEDDDLSLFEPTLLNFLTENLSISVKSANKFLDLFMDEVVRKEQQVGENFRDIVEDIVRALHVTIESSDNSSFIQYIRDKYGNSLASFLEEQQQKQESMLAFDLGDEDDEFGFTRQQSTGSGIGSFNSKVHGDKELLNQSDSKEYVGLSRRNLQSDSEEGSEDEEGSHDRHFKRRMARGRDRSGSKEDTKRSRSRSPLNDTRKNARQQRQQNVIGKEDYDPLNIPQTNSREASMQMKSLGAQNQMSFNNMPMMQQQINPQMLQQMNPQQQQQFMEAQRNMWAMYNRNNPLMQQYQAQMMAAQQQQQQNPGAPVPVKALPVQKMQNNTEMQQQQMGGKGQGFGKQNQSSLLKSPGAPQINSTLANMPAAKLQARKFSIYVKNIPDDLNNIGDLNSYFSQFGHINNINVDLTKKTALIKFKEIESAQKAAASTDIILNNPKIKVIYTVIEPQQQQNEEGNSPSKGPNSQTQNQITQQKKEEIQAQTVISKAGNKTYESEEMQRKRKLAELKKEIEQQRKDLMEKINNELKQQIGSLNEEGLTQEQKLEIEKVIDTKKAKLNQLIKEEQDQRQKEKQEFQQQKAAQYKQKMEMNKPVEIQIYDIGEKYKQFNAFLTTLRKFGRVSDFKYTNEEKTTALMCLQKKDKRNKKRKVQGSK
eukprot:403332576